MTITLGRQVPALRLLPQYLLGGIAGGQLLTCFHVGGHCKRHRRAKIFFFSIDLVLGHVIHHIRKSFLRTQRVRTA